MQKMLRLQLNARKVNFPSVTSLKTTKNDNQQFNIFSKICPGSKHQRKMNSSFLTRNRTHTYCERKILSWKKLEELLKNWMRILFFFHFENLLGSVKVVKVFHNVHCDQNTNSSGENFKMIEI